MLQFQPVTLKDKMLISEFMAKRPPVIIEHSFNTLFAWQEQHAFEWAVFEDWLIIKTTYQGITSMLPPLGPREGLVKPLKEVLSYFEKNSLPCLFTEATLSDISYILRTLPNTFKTVPDRNAANYIYRARDLLELKGKRYHSKKNHINTFRKNYPHHSFLPLTTRLIPYCIETLEEWCIQHNCKIYPTLLQEKTAILKLFENFGDLDYLGACMVVNGKIEGFTIGEQLNENTVAIQIEKANGAIKGLYPAINQMFLTQFWQNNLYVNRAEDLGLANLRKAKMSYHPCALAMKYQIKLLSPCHCC
ncbi:MAG: phosphatidylglycerol lysyltransferase domain-containing protein [Clostridia bacterium]|nr:phosphatidylglycerol lysyltransferase domain-containing protein [Clostridia bacterium]